MTGFTRAKYHENQIKKTYYIQEIDPRNDYEFLKLGLLLNNNYFENDNL